MKVQISSGKGPCECELAVGMYFEKLKEEYSNLKLVEAHQGKVKGCFTYITCELDEAAGLKQGSVLWICESPYRANCKRKNWYIDVSILEEVKKVSTEEIIRFETFRRGGKGGQHVNKVETGVRAIHMPTGIAVVSTEARSQHMNKQIAMNRLLDLLAQINEDANQKEKQLAWLEQNRLIRGNPIRIFKGRAFKEI